MIELHMGIEIVRATIMRSSLRNIASEQFGDLVKAVIDVDRGIMAIGGDMHADEEAALIDSGSIQQNRWGINLYPDVPDDQWVEFDSITYALPNPTGREMWRVL